MRPLDYGDDVSSKPHTLFVKSFNEHFKAHECTFGDSRTVLVDLFVNGDFPESIEPIDLIGKTVSVKFTHGFLWLAHDVRVAESVTAPDGGAA